MLKRENNILLTKVDAYSNRIIRLYKYLKDVEKEFILSKQLLRSGTSIGANIAESQSAQSSADFIHKLEVALKEAKETHYWLEKLLVGEYINEVGYKSMSYDNIEIIKLLTSIIITKKRNMSSGFEIKY
ncbi:four helix bundle protein [Prevotella melaninogenica]|uniref:four helix bundle protein n=1 Tax=Prevotella melaninogenica TaxID=28132 RepID=UPI001C5CCAC8|nr:four helix bundle protein [Prevotella melaninogenica]MBF1430368.1 four helix bundle protein [Prevotella melaninogenica]MBW4742367.1 four helix bundle protein [Prevotella melaninogenica]MBW4912713.1 four helix bundle protein [Prevotella melaninogenica]